MPKFGTSAFYILAGLILASFIFDIHVLGDFFARYLAPLFRYGIVWLIFPILALRAVLKGEFDSRLFFEDESDIIRRETSPKQFWSAVISSSLLGFGLCLCSLYLAFRR